MPQPLRVLIVEDNPNDAELVLRDLRRAGFDPDWQRVETEHDYLDRLKPDLDIILSDYDMPEFSGPRALELLKHRGMDTPFIIISGTIGEDVAVDVMKLGATDYLLKDRLARLGASIKQALEQKRLQTERRRIEMSLNLVRTLVEHSSDGFEVIDPETGRFLDVNETTCLRLGYSRDELLSMSVPDVEAMALDFSTWSRHVDEVRRTGFKILEGRHRRKDGSTFPVEVNVRYVKLDRDYLIAAVRDNTERKLAEESLRLSEERFRQLAENIQEVFWVTDTTKNQMLYISPAYETVWGRTCDSLHASPRTWLEAIHPEDRERVLHAATTRQIDGTYDEEYRILRPDGSLRWIRDRAFPVQNASGETYRVVGLARDISGRKQAEDRLREQASLLDKARDAILVRDLEHGITYWNKSAEQLYGWTAEEVIGRKVTELIYRDLVAFEKAIEEVIRLGEWHGEIQQVTKTGTQILIEARWTLVRDATGRPKSILAINTDITEKKKLEQQYLRVQRMESIGTLAGGIAHDLNNVLAPILMSIELLRLTSRDERARSMLSTIETSAKRGADMVRQILFFARGVEGQRVMITPRQIIEEMQHLLQDTFPKNILCHVDLPAALPAFFGDSTQVHQVLLNLCVNARDAMPGGGTLAISARSISVDESYAASHPGARPGAYVMLKVADTGTGIPPEVVEKIFDPFFTTKELGKGTGLGLSTVLAIVKSHDGFLNVETEPGQGTTFLVNFPANLSPTEDAMAAQEDMNPRGQGELILIVDDEAAVCAITKQTLEAFGYRVLVAADGTEAVSLYTRHQAEVAAVLTDMMMPIMDGPATIHVLKHLNPRVKIIAASGLANDSGAARAAGMGVKHFLPKPYTAQTVLTTLRLALNDDA
ncbi:PAS domain S-box protein [Prosthecobacter sp.]|uniref:hybrid sensor histidine kinase/response regulator n=1 Tax=Prosthecobacter sp. TaxID=1965333 RepID=UPI002ABA7D67|nr:PAS domain S-box protein [Prosthecobacter sp.]MDZ4402454.1 PAS domain S-box protein [Prosthecobacter sp.]